MTKLRMPPQRKASPLLPLLLLASAGAAFAAEVQQDVERVVQERTGASLVRDPDGASPQQLDALLAGELTVERAVQAALLHNRSLQASLRDLEIADAELRQARLIKNPELEYEMRHPGRPYEFALTQDVVDLFLRPLRKRVASSSLRQTQLRVAHSVLDLAAEVRSAFYSLQATSQARTMRATIVEASRASADLAQRQYAAGNISDLMLENNQALYEEAKLDLAESEVEVVEARERLNRLIGTWGAQTTWHVAEHLPELPDEEPEADGLESLAVSKRLDLAATDAEVMAAKEAVPLAQFGQWPTLGLGVHVEREPEGTRTVGPAFHVSLPLFDRGQAAAAGARSRFEQSIERRAALAVEIRSEVRSVHARLQAARQRVAYYREVVLPRRERIVAQTQREYNFMLVGVYQLIQARRDEVEARSAYIEAQRDYWLARTELERTVGGELVDDGGPERSAIPAGGPPHVVQ